MLQRRDPFEGTHDAGKWEEVGVFDGAFDCHEEFGGIRIADGGEIILPLDAAERLARALPEVIAYTRHVEEERDHHAQSLVSEIERSLHEAG